MGNRSTMENYTNSMSTLETSLTCPLSRVGFGSFHIGRIAGDKYASFGRPVPSVDESNEILNGVLDLGITLIDTAPSYGLSELRIGKQIKHRRSSFNLCSKVGELWEEGNSTFDFSRTGMKLSIENSLINLQTDYIDILLIHAPDDDLRIIQETDAIDVIQNAKQEGKVKAIGFSGKTLQAQLEALEWSDVMMVEYNVANQVNEPVIKKANETGKLVLIKKALNSGHLPSEEAIKFLSQTSQLREMIDCVVIGSTSVNRMKENIELFNA